MAWLPTFYFTSMTDITNWSQHTVAEPIYTLTFSMLCSKQPLSVMVFLWDGTHCSSRIRQYGYENLRIGETSEDGIESLMGMDSRLKHTGVEMCGWVCVCVQCIDTGEESNIREIQLICCTVIIKNFGK